MLKPKFKSRLSDSKVYALTYVMLLKTEEVCLCKFIVIGDGRMVVVVLMIREIGGSDNVRNLNPLFP